MQFPQSFRHARKRLDRMNAAVKLFAAASCDTAHLSSRNAEKSYELMRAHVPCLLKIRGMQRAKPELARQLVQNHHASIEGIRNRAIEVKNQQLRPTWGMCPAFSAPQPTAAKDVAGKSSHAVASSSFNSIVPLNFGSSASSPKLPATKAATRSISSLDSAGLSGAPANSRSCSES